MKMMSLQQISRLCLGAVLSTLTLGTVRAELLIYEPFDYEAEGEINFQNGGQGFSSEWMDAGSGSEDAETMRNGSLSYGSLHTSGNSMRAVSLNDTTNIIRATENAAGAAGSTTWVSFIFALEGDSGSVDDGDQFNLMLSRSDGLSPAATYAVGAYASGGTYYFGLGNLDQPLQVSSMPFVAGETYFVTASIEWNGNGTKEVIRLFVNPDLSGGTPDPSSAVALLDTQDLAFGSINTLGGVAVSSGDFGTEWAFDELRIGTTFGDVAPAPEPSTALLLLGGLGLLIKARCRRDPTAGAPARAA